MSEVNVQKSAGCNEIKINVKPVPVNPIKINVKPVPVNPIVLENSYRGIDYNVLKHKPQIEGNELIGNKTAKELLGFDKTDMDATVSVAKGAEEVANAANEKAQNAVDISNDAKETADGIDAKATKALTNSNTAVNTANSAKQTADGIDAKATKALTNSNTAVNTANSAKQTAEGIDDKATQALTNSATALETATQAKNTADSYQGQITTIESKIPNDATEQNQLVTKTQMETAIAGSSVDLSGYYNRDNLLGADEIEIVEEPVDGGIDEHTMGCWHFDGNNENAVDGSVMTSSSTGFDTNGKFGSCTKKPTFTGWMPTSSDDYTWDFWFKTSTITGYDNGQVGGIGNYSGGYKYGCFYKQNEKLYAVRNGESMAEQPFATLQENVWTHLALTRQNNIERWFVNGKLIRQGENTYNATVKQVFKSATNADFCRTDEYRISDIARYTEDFEPPTKPYSVAVPTGNYVVRNKTKLVHKSDIGIANGVAGLDASGKVPAEQIPTGSGFDFEGTKAEFDAAVAAGTITEDSVSLITDDVSGDTVATKAELQAVDISKADTALSNVLANIDYVVDSFSDEDGNWYRKYKSGWLEQGGISATVSATAQQHFTVTLLKPMLSNNYSVLGNYCFVSGQSSSLVTTKITNESTINFTTEQSNNTGAREGFIRWYVCGKGAENV